MNEERAALVDALDTTPGSIRELAREAGVSETTLRRVRDGERRLTPEVRDAVAGALRRWGTRCRDAAGALEAVDLKKGGTNG